MSANQSNPNRTSLVSIIVPAVFLLVGSFIFGSSFVRPFLKSRDAKNWNETSCIIISSRVKEISTRNGTQEVVDIVYSYELHGQTYRSNRYAFRERYNEDDVAEVYYLSASYASRYGLSKHTRPELPDEYPDYVLATRPICQSCMEQAWTHNPIHS